MAGCKYPFGDEISRGKTKAIHQGPRTNTVVLRNFSDITANDDPSVTQQLGVKAVAATTTTCRIFELLRDAGIPVAYIERVTDTAFEAYNCKMVPIEAVARRYAVGSYLKRHPEMGRETTPPFRFPWLVTELFLKTTNGRCVLGDGNDHDFGLDPSKGQEDPLMIWDDEKNNRWLLRHSKLPAWEAEADLGSVDDNLVSFDDEKLTSLLRRVFWVLEGAWSTLGWRLIDIKIEVGIVDGKMVVTDVIDNDSWRLRDTEWQEMSKQVFRDQIARDGVDLDDLSWRYQLVADLTGQLRIPEQAIVLWLGSFSDYNKVREELENVKKTIAMPAGVLLHQVALSGHRQTNSVLKAISAIESEYPNGAVIIACVGLSNGLGPIVSAHTHLPVVSVPLTPEDWMSSARLPGRVPASTMLKLENAVHQALQILGQKNPAAYAVVRELAEADTGLDADCILL